MVNIDNVYQKVLAIANKEQRGYITPQEFNLFADQAQMSIFEQYFYDLSQFLRVPGNDTDYADAVVQASPEMDKEVLAHIKNLEKPFMEYPGETDYIDAYQDFYARFIEEEEVVITQ